VSEALNILACIRVSEGGSREGRGKVRGRIVGSKKISHGKNVKRKRANARVSVETSFWRYRKDDLDCFMQIHQYKQFIGNY